jgi:LPXTG-motif cell wall-anchored protein
MDTPKNAPAPTALPEWLQKLVGQGNVIMLASAGGGVLVLVLGGGFFLWKRKRRKKGTVAVEGKTQLTSPTDAAGKELEARLQEQMAEHQRQEAEAMLSLKLPAVSTKKTDVLVKHIGAEVKKDPVAMAHVVRSWLNGEYQR